MPVINRKKIVYCTYVCLTLFFTGLVFKSCVKQEFDLSAENLQKDKSGHSIFQGIDLSVNSFGPPTSSFTPIHQQAAWLTIDYLLSSPAIGYETLDTIVTYYGLPSWKYLTFESNNLPDTLGFVIPLIKNDSVSGLFYVKTDETDNIEGIVAVNLNSLKNYLTGTDTILLQFANNSLDVISLFEKVIFDRTIDYTPFNKPEPEVAVRDWEWVWINWKICKEIGPYAITGKEEVDVRELDCVTISFGGGQGFSINNTDGIYNPFGGSLGGGGNGNNSSSSLLSISTIVINDLFNRSFDKEEVDDIFSSTCLQNILIGQTIYDPLTSDVPELSCVRDELKCYDNVKFILIDRLYLELTYKELKDLIGGYQNCQGNPLHLYNYVVAQQPFRNYLADNYLAELDFDINERASAKAWLSDVNNWSKFHQFYIFLKEHSTESGLKDYQKKAIKMCMEDNEYVPQRFNELWTLVYNDPYALVRGCAEGNPDYPLSFWGDNAVFTPPQACLDKINSLGEGWRIQYFLTPTLAPSINLDYFPVTITQLPVKNTQTGERWQAQDLFQHIRKNINDFVNTNNTEFTFTPSENAIWQSSNPLTAISSLEIKLGGIPADDGSVICSEAQPWGWVFSTIKTPQFGETNDGFHPVSGNREFAYKVNSDGSFTFYTKGVDRYFYPLPQTNENIVLAFLFEKVAFAGADNLWDSFQDGIVNFVITHGGQAVKNTPVKHRPKTKDALKPLFKSATDLTPSILCGD